MTDTSSSFFVHTVLVLLMVSAAVSLFVRWVKLPYSVGLVIVGLLIGLLNLLPGVKMTPGLILLVFLPALLFEASWNINVQELKQEKIALAVLSTAGVVISMFLVAGFLHFFLGLDANAALLFGSMISATDPISVIALFRKLNVDRRLILLLEGESLFNDGTAVVLFQLVMAFAVYGQTVSAPSGILEFLVVCAGGLGLGALVGFTISYITRFFDDHLPEIMLTSIAAYGSFMLGDALHVSPVLAVVVAGIVIGNYGSRTSMSPSTRLAVNSFWEYAAFAGNSLVFLLIGIQISLAALEKYRLLILGGIAATLLARIVVVYGLCPLLSSARNPISAGWMHLLFWGGLRGALCMSLALSLPLDYPLREPIIIMCFGVVLFTLLVPGLTMEPLVKLMKVGQFDPRLANYSKLHVKLIIETESLAELSQLRAEGKIAGESADELEAEIRARIAQIEAKISDLHLADASLKELQKCEIKLRLLEKRKDTLLRLSKQGFLDEESSESIRLDLDERIDRLMTPSAEQKQRESRAGATGAPEDKPAS
jgi:monovalent cation:H+ antiporter, CPA1 family